MPTQQLQALQNMCFATVAAHRDMLHAKRTTNTVTIEAEQKKFMQQFENLKAFNKQCVSDVSLSADELNSAIEPLLRVMVQAERKALKPPKKPKNPQFSEKAFATVTKYAKDIDFNIAPYIAKMSKNKKTLEEHIAKHVDDHNKQFRDIKQPVSVTARAEYAKNIARSKYYLSFKSISGDLLRQCKTILVNDVARVAYNAMPPQHKADWGIVVRNDIVTFTQKNVANNKGTINASVNDKGEATFSTENANPNDATIACMVAAALSGPDNTMELGGSDANIITKALQELEKQHKEKYPNQPGKLTITLPDLQDVMANVTSEQIKVIITSLKSNRSESELDAYLKKTITDSNILKTVQDYIANTKNTASTKNLSVTTRTPKPVNNNNNTENTLMNKHIKELLELQQNKNQSVGDIQLNTTLLLNNYPVAVQTKAFLDYAIKNNPIGAIAIAGAINNHGTEDQKKIIAEAFSKMSDPNLIKLLGKVSAMQHDARKDAVGTLEQILGQDKLAQLKIMATINGLLTHKANDNEIIAILKDYKDPGKETQLREIIKQVIASSTTYDKPLRIASILHHEVQNAKIASEFLKTPPDNALASAKSLLAFCKTTKASGKIANISQDQLKKLYNDSHKITDATQLPEAISALKEIMGPEHFALLEQQRQAQLNTSRMKPEHEDAETTDTPEVNQQIANLRQEHRENRAVGDKKVRMESMLSLKKHKTKRKKTTKKNTIKYKNYQEFIKAYEAAKKVEGDNPKAIADFYKTISLKQAKLLVTQVSNDAISAHIDYDENDDSSIKPTSKLQQLEQCLKIMYKALKDNDTVDNKKIAEHLRIEINAQHATNMQDLADVEHVLFDMTNSGRTFPVIDKNLTFSSNTVANQVYNACNDSDDPEGAKATRESIATMATTHQHLDKAAVIKSSPPQQRGGMQND